MTINDQIRDEKLQCDINRETVKISVLFSGKILLKSFWKISKKIEDQVQKQDDALNDLKPKEQRKPIEDKSNNQSKATIIFSDLINNRAK